MFLRWMNARIRAAQRALEDGRLDEAYERLRDASVRAERAARDVLAGLGKALLARARLHAQAGRYGEALLDLERLDALEQMSDEGRALRGRVEQEQRARIGRHAENAEAFRKVAEHVRAGSLETGKLALERIEDPARREQLREEIDVRLHRGEQLVQQAAAALESGDWLTACRFWEEAVARHGRSARTDEMAMRLAPRYAEAVDGWLRDGRLDRVRSALGHTARLREHAPQLAEYDKLAQLVQRAGAQLSAADFGALRTTLARLRAAAGEASWLTRASAALEKLMDAHEELCSSPLGLLGPSLVGTRGAEPAHAAARALPGSEGLPARPHGHGAPAARPGAAGVPPVASVPPVAGQAERPGQRQPARGAPLGLDPLLLLVDGTGSCLLIAGDIVRIGRAGGLAGIDVPIPADIQSHHADVERDGGDYFLAAHGPVRVNQRTVTRTLLRDGDRIALGDAARLTFSQPSAKSETAVLRISSRNRLPLDVSSVVLFRETCVIGPSPSCHVQTREGDTRLVLFDRGGELFVRRAGRDGRPTGPAEPLAADTTVDVGDQRVTVKGYKIAS